MSKRVPSRKPSEMREAIRKVSEKVSKWPEWKRGGSAAAAKATAAVGSKKSPAG